MKIIVRAFVIFISFSEVTQKEASMKSIRCVGTCGFFLTVLRPKVKFAPPCRKIHGVMGFARNDGFCFLHGPEI